MKNLGRFCLIFASFLTCIICMDFDDLCGLDLKDGPLKGKKVACKTIGYTVSQLILEKHDDIRAKHSAVTHKIPSVEHFKWSDQLSEEVQNYIDYCGDNCCHAVYADKPRISYYVTVNSIYKTDWVKVVNDFHDKISNASTIWLEAKEVGCATQRYLNKLTTSPPKTGEDADKTAKEAERRKRGVHFEDGEEPDHDLSSYLDPETRSKITGNNRYTYRYTCLYKK